MYSVDRNNVETLLDRGELYVAMSNGNWWKMRRNGATKKWAKDASRVRIPFKAGLKVYGQITETDFKDGRLDDSLFRHVSDTLAYQKA